MSNEQLVDEIQRGQNVSDNLGQLYLQNQVMLRKTAESFLWSKESLEDLMQSGWIGMQTAVSKYDPSPGFKFLTYAMFWIRQEIKRYIENNGSLVRLPSSRQEQVYRYRDFLKSYRTQHGQDPTDQQICAALDVSDQVLQSIRKADRMQQLDSLDRPLPGTDDFILSDMLEGPQNVSEEVTDEALADDIKNQIQKLLDALQKDQRTAVVETVMNCRTLEDVGQELGVSYQRVAQLRELAIRNLRRSRSIRKLQQDVMDLYGMAIRGSGLSTFRNNGTSSTEAAALRLLDADKAMKSRIAFLCDLEMVKTWIIMTQLQRADGPTATGVIKELVSDPELQRILIRVIVNGEKTSRLQEIEYLKYRGAMSELNRKLSELHSDRAIDGPDHGPDTA